MARWHAPCPQHPANGTPMISIYCAFTPSCVPACRRNRQAQFFPNSLAVAARLAFPIRGTVCDNRCRGLDSLNRAEYQARRQRLRRESRVRRPLPATPPHQPTAPGFAPTATPTRPPPGAASRAAPSDSLFAGGTPAVPPGAAASGKLRGKSPRAPPDNSGTGFLLGHQPASTETVHGLSVTKVW